jgi:glycolate oxidase
MPGAGIDALAAALSGGAEAVLTDPEVVEGYRFDRSGGTGAGHPLAVVRAAGTADVEATLRWAGMHRVPVVPRGAGTGLSGGSCAVDGCIVLSTERMRSLEVDPRAQVAVVGPGVLNGELKEAAASHGLWYPPDPSSFEICSIGGNVATNAGGLCCLKYGVTTDYVLGLEVVLADGRVLRLGGRTVKDVAGYDLKRLFTGSEGTLGVITEVTLRLVPLGGPKTTMVAAFAELTAAGRAITAIRGRTRPAVLEFMDATALAAVEDRLHMGLDRSWRALVLAASDLSAPAAAEEVAVMVACCEAEGATDVAFTDDPVEGEQLLAARRMAIPAVEHLGSVLIEDVAVPLDRIAELVGGTAEVAERHATTIALIGHAGDGNFHPLVVFDPSDDDAQARARQAFGAVMELSLALGGTITGEHGVGTLKRPWLRAQLGDEVLDVTRRIKESLDPLGILNPGKAL